MRTDNTKAAATHATAAAPAQPTLTTTARSTDTMLVDGMPVPIEGERNLLEVIRKAGVELPVFCYHTDLSIFGACRMCMVEDERGWLMAACSTVPRAGMSVLTNTARLRHYRRTNLELLLASHCKDCTTCINNGRCKLQSLAAGLGIRQVRFEDTREPAPVDASSPAVVRDASKCILCGDCVRECNEIQHVGAIDLAFRGSNATVSTAFDLPLAQTTCVGCGQCAAACPTGAIVVHDHTTEAWAALADPAAFVTCEVAPAVRVAIGKELSVPAGENAMGRIVAALHHLGFDEVFDTATGADLTVTEEAAELVERLEQGEGLPLFTSCCPAWVQFVEKSHPELVGHLSTCKSPMGMFAATAKRWYAHHLPEGKTRHVHVALMPCTAKKVEAARPEFAPGGSPDTDVVITTQEFITMVRESGLRFDELEPESVDLPFGAKSGAGVIFGVTGGVTEAVLRNIAPDAQRTTLEQVAHAGERGMEDRKVFELAYGERTLRVAVVSGLARAHELIRQIEAGEEHFDFVEVMACPGGCIGGAGQPYVSHRRRVSRGEGLYAADRASSIRRPRESPLVRELYEGVLAGREHELLHVSYASQAGE